MDNAKRIRAESWKGLTYQETKDRLMELDVPDKLLKVLANTIIVKDTVRNPSLSNRDDENSNCFAADGKPTRLTDREQTVMQMSAFGLTADDIAMVLNLDRETIKTHKKRALAALRVRNTNHAIAILVRQGVI